MIPRMVSIVFLKLVPNLKRCNCFCVVRNYKELILLLNYIVESHITGIRILLEPNGFPFDTYKQNDDRSFSSFHSFIFLNIYNAWRRRPFNCYVQIKNELDPGSGPSMAILGSIFYIQNFELDIADILMTEIKPQYIITTWITDENEPFFIQHPGLLAAAIVTDFEIEDHYQDHAVPYVNLGKNLEDIINETILFA